MLNRLRHIRKDQNQVLSLDILPYQNSKIPLRGPLHCRHCLHPPKPVTLHTRLSYVAHKELVKSMFKKRQEEKIIQLMR